MDIHLTADTHEFNPHISGVDLDLQIKTAADFDTWVRGAMAELSDGAVVPKHMTYDYVLGVARQIRSTIPNGLPRPR